MKKLLTLLFLLITGVSFAQKVPDYGFNKIRIALSDRIIQADLTPLKSDPVVETDRMYHWSSSNSIHITQGGFSGKLLNGDYVEYYLNKNLKEQGQFKGGLKDGIWKSWNEKGVLIELYSWVDGMRSGKFELFDGDGKLKQTGYYKSNMLHGKIIIYADGKAETVNYRNGKITEKKPSAFFNRINIFKQFKKDSIGKNTVRKQPAKPTP